MYRSSVDRLVVENLLEAELGGIQPTPSWPPPQTRRIWFELFVSFILRCSLCQSAVLFSCGASCTEGGKPWFELLKSAVQVDEFNRIYVATVSVNVVGTKSIQVEFSSFMEELLQKLWNQHLGCSLYPSLVKVDAIIRMDSLLSEMQDDGVHAMPTPWPSFNFHTAIVQLKTILPLVRFLICGFSWLLVISCSVRVTSAHFECCTYMTMSRKLADVVGLLGFLSFGLVVVTTLAVDLRPIPWPPFRYSALERIVHSCKRKPFLCNLVIEESDLMSALWFYFELLVDYELLETRILRDDFMHLSAISHSDFHVSPYCNFSGLVPTIRPLQLLSQWTFHYLLFLLNGSEEATSVLLIGAARWKATGLLLLHERKIVAVTLISVKTLLDCTLTTVLVEYIALQPCLTPEMLDIIINGLEIAEQMAGAARWNFGCQSEVLVSENPNATLIFGHMAGLQNCWKISVLFDSHLTCLHVIFILVMGSWISILILECPISPWPPHIQVELFRWCSKDSDFEARHEQLLLMGFVLLTTGIHVLTTWSMPPQNARHVHQVMFSRNMKLSAHGKAD